MLTLDHLQDSKVKNFPSKGNNMASEKCCIEYISKLFENKGCIKPKVVLWKYRAVSPIWFYLGKLCTKGRHIEKSRPDSGVLPEIGNDVGALAAITAIAKCRMKNTRSIRFAP